MSDTWYREPLDLPPYEDWFGNLWTWDGQILNPVLGPEPEEIDFVAELGRRMKQVFVQMIEEKLAADLDQFRSSCRGILADRESAVVSADWLCAICGDPSAPYVPCGRCGGMAVTTQRRKAVSQ